jgi:hypothetical protein
MNKAFHYDLAEVERHADAMLKQCVELKDADGAPGARARLAIAILKSFAIYQAGEANRLSTASAVCSAVTDAAAHMIAMQASSALGVAGTPETRRMLAQEMLTDMASRLIRKLEQVDNGQSYIQAPIVGGNS